MMDAFSQTSIVIEYVSCQCGWKKQAMHRIAETAVAGWLHPRIAAVSQ